MHIQHPQLHELARDAAYLATLVEAVGDLEMLCENLPEEERFEPVPREEWHEDAHSLDVALHLLVVA